MNNSTWEAPRAAYLLTAAIADNAHRDGAIMPGNDGMNAEWGGYDEAAQQDILAALGAQTRLALRMLREKLGIDIEMDWESTARVACSHAPAQCAHCREVIAKAMCSLQIQAYFRLGFTPAMIAAMCRQSADEPQASPRHRETSIQSSALSRGHSPCEPNMLR